MSATERLVIEPLDHPHAEGLVAALDDPSVGEHIGGPAVTTVDAMHARIDQLAAGPAEDSAEDHWWNWAVRRREDGQVLGYIQATGFDAVDATGPWAEIAYVFGPATGGRGYATEATIWLIDHLAQQGISELWACIHHANEPSRRLIERVGFHRVDHSPRPLSSYDDGDLVYALGEGPGVTAHD